MKCRAWWQDKSKLRGCLMKRTKHITRLVRTLIVSAHVCIVMIGPWDLVLSSEFCCVTQWSPADDEYPTELACHCDSLNDFITLSHTHLSIYVRTQLMLFIYAPPPNTQNDWSWAESSVTDAVWYVESYSILSFKPFMTPFSMCIYHILDFSQMNFYLPDNSETFITAHFKYHSALGSL